MTSYLIDRLSPSIPLIHLLTLKSLVYWVNGLFVSGVDKIWSAGYHPL